MQFVKESVFPVPASALWAFHERADAFALLSPPWQTMEILQPPRSLEVGTIVKLRVNPLPLPLPSFLWQTIEAEHIDYQAGRMFVDRMNKGPFAQWIHTHTVTPISDSESKLTDSIEYELPLGALGRLAGGAFARRELEKLFAFRHEVTKKNLI
jgi:ligand-binding SRPBCC domain-containing protein